MTKTWYYPSRGIIKIVVNEAHVVSLKFQQQEDGGNESSPLIVACMAELDAYFKGHLSDFSIPYQLSGTDFQNKVWTALAGIPYRKTRSYSTLAIQIGDLKSIRAVGSQRQKQTSITNTLSSGDW